MVIVDSVGSHFAWLFSSTLCDVFLALLRGDRGTVSLVYPPVMDSKIVLSHRDYSNMPFLIALLLGCQIVLIVLSKNYLVLLFLLLVSLLVLSGGIGILQKISLRLVWVHYYV